MEALVAYANKEVNVSCGSLFFIMQRIQLINQSRCVDYVNSYLLLDTLIRCNTSNQNKSNKIVCKIQFIDAVILKLFAIFLLKILRFINANRTGSVLPAYCAKWDKNPQFKWYWNLRQKPSTFLGNLIANSIYYSKRNIIDHEIDNIGHAYHAEGHCTGKWPCEMRRNRTEKSTEHSRIFHLCWSTLSSGTFGCQAVVEFLRKRWLWLKI